MLLTVCGVSVVCIPASQRNHQENGRQHSSLGLPSLNCSMHRYKPIQCNRYKPIQCNISPFDAMHECVFASERLRCACFKQSYSQGGSALDRTELGAWMVVAEMWCGSVASMAAAASAARPDRTGLACLFQLPAACTVKNWSGQTW